MIGLKQHFNKTRIAPTPSGFLHPGNVLSFSLTAAIAKQCGANVLLRIDDMDHDRKEEKYISNIFETLSLLNIHWNEGPRNAKEFEASYSQKNRLAVYELYLKQLRDSALVYACTCSRSQIISENSQGFYTGNCLHKGIPLDTPDACWRIDTSRAERILINTYQQRALRLTLPTQMNHFIVRRKDGLPAYQLTSLADDVFFGIDLVVRGKDLWPSTLAQLFLAQQLELKQFLEVVFYHHKLLNSRNGEKLSKLAGNNAYPTITSSSLPETVFAFISEQLGLPGSIKKWQHLGTYINSLQSDF